jgi:FkbM family methyltransferase
MKIDQILTKSINRILRFASHIGFKIKYPYVKVMRPNEIGTFYSQDGQDLVLASLLFNYINNNSNPWVLDIGCNHPSHYSNSLFFEKWFGCRVLAIDPLEEFGPMWAHQRPSATFIPAAIGCISDSVVLRVPKGELSDNMFSTVDGGVNKRKDVELIERNVTCLRLSDVLFSHNINEVMLMSIDVEGLELEVLKSIDFEKVTIRCIVLENNSTNLYGSNCIRKFLLQHGYIFIVRIGFLDDVFVHGSMINGHSNSLLL